jgi:hypothetical protein
MIIPAELYCGRGIGFRPSMNLIFCGVGAFEVGNTEYGKENDPANQRSRIYNKIFGNMFAKRLLSLY